MAATEPWYKLTIEAVGTRAQRTAKIKGVEVEFEKRYESAPHQFGISLARDRSPDGSITLYFSPEAMHLEQLREYVMALGAESCEESPNLKKLLLVMGDTQKYLFENLHEM